MQLEWDVNTRGFVVHIPCCADIEKRDIDGLIPPLGWLHLFDIKCTQCDEPIPQAWMDAQTLYCYELRRKGRNMRGLEEAVKMRNEALEGLRNDY